MSFDSSMRANAWKWLALLALAVFSFCVTMPPEEKIRLGLDLRGGTSFTLGVDEEALRDSVLADIGTNSTEEAIQKGIEDRLSGDVDDRIIEVVRRRVDGMGMNEPVIQLAKGHRVLVQLPNMVNTNNIEKQVAKLKEALDKTADAKEKAKIRDELERLRDPRAEARRALQSAAYLEFRLAHKDNHQMGQDLMVRVGKTHRAPEGYALNDAGTGFVRLPDYDQIKLRPGYKARLSSFGRPPQGYQFMLEKDKEGFYQPNYISRKADLSGKDLVSAHVDRDEMGRVVVAFKLNSKGGTTMRKLSGRNIGRQLAIILDGELISAPVLQSEIGTSGQISGNFSQPEAKRLSDDLKAGALPVPLIILSEENVTATVGNDAQKDGLVAAVLGFALVALFMLIYYWYAGAIANVALVLDIILLPAALVCVANVLGVFAKNAEASGLALPVLTMPGIAGIVLTLGMAVDANVIIFERIREEFANKVSVGTAIKNGYGRAFTAILDSNITTIVTGIILFIVGTGPVRGFAITLTAGVIISMFTAVVVTRLVFEKTTNPDSMKPFKMLNIFKKVPNVDFVKLGKVMVISSLAIVVVSIAVFGFRAAVNPRSVLAVDLTGGTSITLSAKKMPSIADVRKTLAPFDDSAIIQEQRAIEDQTQNDGQAESQVSEKRESLLVKTSFTTENVKEKGIAGNDVPAHITRLLQDAFPDADIKQEGGCEIGSVVGADLKESGTLAVIFSLCAILIYVAIRFEFGFGLGALVALAHDALISLGLFSLCGRQVSLLVITALLTIIGYSVNDTIVVFDRIREDLRKDQKSTFKDLCNRALNECLSRTVITSITTFFAVLALFAFGDGSIFDFALTMLIGVIAGTYSSVFIATPIMMWFYKGRRPKFSAEGASK